MLKIRRPLGRLIFNMGIAIPGKTVFLIETAPSGLTRLSTGPSTWGFLYQTRDDLQVAQCLKSFAVRPICTDLFSWEFSGLLILPQFKIFCETSIGLINQCQINTIWDNFTSIIDYSKCESRRVVERPLRPSVDLEPSRLLCTAAARGLKSGRLPEAAALCGENLSHGNWWTAKNRGLAWCSWALQSSTRN